MKYQWSVVFVHYNNPTALIKSCLALRERREMRVKFFLIDNSSGLAKFFLATLIMKALVGNVAIVRRSNKNREAGGYWYFINELYDGESMVLFSQDELHQTGMRPKGVKPDLDTKAMPFYTEFYGYQGISLENCYNWLINAPLDSIGFGGKRCRQSVLSDVRFTTNHWKQRWRDLHLTHYDFFSGACFAVGPSGVKKFRELGQPTAEDLEDPVFAYMWERMWGTIPLLAGGDLVHYQTKDKCRIDAWLNEPGSSWDFSGPRYCDARLEVAPKNSVGKND